MPQRCLVDAEVCGRVPAGAAAPVAGNRVASHRLTSAPDLPWGDI